MECYCLFIKSSEDMETAWDCLTKANIHILYSAEDSVEEKQIFAMLESGSDEKVISQFDFIDRILLSPLVIDWNAQWIEHGHNFHDGFVHIDLSKFCDTFIEPRTLRLKPGPGFGDLSHPTTYLVLKMLGHQHIDGYVIDIGAGSGILSLAAAAMGANKVQGIEIDPQAIEHAVENALVNDLQTKTNFSLPSDFKIPKNIDKVLVLMNMIWSEQIVAWKSLTAIHKLKGDMLVSGLLVTDRDVYLELCQQWGWKLVSEIEKEGWLGLHFAIS